jgi:hypothetical protein
MCNNRIAGSVMQKHINEPLRCIGKIRSWVYNFLLRVTRSHSHFGILPSIKPKSSYNGCFARPEIFALACL